MDERSKEYLNKILAKGPQALNSGEVAFLRARRSYLKKSQLEEYDEILFPKKEVVQLSRKELEAKALEVGIKNPDNKKLFPKNSDLASAIEAQAKPAEEQTVNKDHANTE